MKFFEECLKRNGLGDLLEAEFSRWGRFSQESADIVLEVSKLESISPELLAYTWVKESCFVLNPMPNTNGHDECIYYWDLGPAQISHHWAYKSVWVGEYKAVGHGLSAFLHFEQVFGREFYKDGMPCSFTGSPIANLRMASRRLLARKGDDEFRAVQYPGPKSREDRREGWKKYGSLFRDFFLNYGEGK